jgi:hypothetical protein
MNATNTVKSYVEEIQLVRLWTRKDINKVDTADISRDYYNNRIPFFTALFIYSKKLGRRQQDL